MPSFSIAAVERDTGLSKDVLRMWERRYGFPIPERDANGERLYPEAQVERLRLIKRLMDQGYRPGKLMATSVDELSLLAPRHRPAAAAAKGVVEDAGLEELLALIKRHDGDGPAPAKAAVEEFVRFRFGRVEVDVPAGCLDVIRCLAESAARSGAHDARSTPGAFHQIVLGSRH